jgi:hypothetical protein
LHSDYSLDTVLVAVRDQSQETRTFDSGVELTLVNGTGASQASWDDFTVFTDEITQCVDVFVVNFDNVSHRETAVALALEQQILCGALRALVFVKTFWSGHDGLLNKVITKNIKNKA